MAMYNGKKVLSVVKTEAVLTDEASEVNYSGNVEGATNVKEALDLLANRKATHEEVEEAQEKIISTNIFFSIDEATSSATSLHNSTWVETNIATLPIQPNTEYTFIVGERVLEGQASNGIINFHFYDINGTFTGSSITTSASPYTKTYTTPQNATMVKIYVSVGTQANVDKTATYKDIKILLGSNTDFVGELKTNIKVNVGNASFICKKEVVEKQDITISGTGFIKHRIVEGLPMKPNQKYSVFVEGFEGDINSKIQMLYYNESGVLLEPLTYFELQPNKKIITFITPIETNKATIEFFNNQNMETDRTTTLTGFGIIEGNFTDKKYFLEKDIETTSSNFDPKNYSLPIMYLEGNILGMSKEVSVDLTYKYGERSGMVNVKWQGSSSLAFPKKNYTLKFDNAFEVKEGWGEQKKYCLKANWVDFSHARNIVGASIWGNIVSIRENTDSKLSVSPNGGAIDGFPILLVINGHYQGLYTFNIPKDGWLMGMGNGTKEAIICAEGGDEVGFNGRPIIGTHFKLEYASDENDISWIQTALDNMYNALANATEENFDETVGAIFDLPSLYDYIIFNTLTAGSDNITRNFLLATYDGVKWFFTPYDMDGSFGMNSSGVGYNPLYGVNLFNDTHNLYSKVIQYKKEEIKARYERLTHWGAPLSNGVIMTHVLNFVNNIPKEIFDEECKLWKGIPSSSTSNANQIINGYIIQKEYIDDFIKKIL